MISTTTVVFYFALFVISMIAALAITIIIILRASGRKDQEDSRISLNKWHKENMDHHGR